MPLFCCRGQDYIAPLIRFTFFMKFYFIRFIIYMV